MGDVDRTPDHGRRGSAEGGTRDVEAWLEAHWERTVAALWRQTVKLFGSPAAAEDALGEVYLAFLERRRTIDPTKDAFLNVRNAIGNHFSNQITSGRAEHEEASGSSAERRAPASAPSPEALTRMKARSDAIEARLEGDPIALALFANVVSGAGHDLSKLGDDKAVANAVRRLKHAIQREDENEEDEGDES